MGFWDLVKGNTSPMKSLVDKAHEAHNQVSIPKTQSLGSSMPSMQTRPMQAASMPTQAAQPRPMTGPEFAPISGVSLEQYANLLALMSDCGEDEERCLMLAASQGVDAAAWVAAKEGWTARMADPALENRVSYAFLDFYSPAMDRKRGGKEPISLEEYTRIFAETSFRKDPLDASKPIDRLVVLKENNLTESKWNECLVYWSPKVSDAQNPVYQRYSQILRDEMQRLLGR
jgi:hypothetical protein